MRVERILPVALERPITIQDDASLADAAKLLCDTHRHAELPCQKLLSGGRHTIVNEISCL